MRRAGVETELLNLNVDSMLALSLSPSWVFSRNLILGQPGRGRSVRVRREKRVERTSIAVSAQVIATLPPRWLSSTGERGALRRLLQRDGFLGGFFLSFRSRASIQRLCVNTPQASASSR